MKILIAGANGRMGQEIRDLIRSSPDLEFGGGFDTKEDLTETIFKSLNKLNGRGQVMIDFSLPQAFDSVLEWCVSQRIPLVSGTTGLGPAQFDKMQIAAKEIGVLWSSNMAPGVQIIKNILKHLQVPADFDMQLTEYHHTNKKDKPSGTAKSLQEILNQKRANLPTPISIRGGGIFGIHRLDLMAPEETITIEHQALSRTVFARGALTVARWLVAQPPGHYTMDNIL